MSEAAPLEQRLEARVRRALEPPRFPERRDVELAFAVIDGAGDVAFLDHFWLDGPTLWVVAARLDGSGLDGGLAAASLRQLLRALSAELHLPRAVVDELLRQRGDGVSALAVACLDTATGTFRHAAHGDGHCGAVDSLSPGDIGWLTVGGPELPEGGRVPAEGLQSLVDGHARPPRRVLAAIHFKAPPKRARTTTLVIRNDRAAVPDALEAARSFLARHAVAEADMAALELALDEILTNQINYGFRDGMAHEILLELRVEGGRLDVEIRDDGVPFDPLSVAPPDLEAGIEERQIGGLGMHFVRSLIDEVSYRRSGGWNVLALGKTLSGNGEQPA